MVSFRRAKLLTINERMSDSSLSRQLSPSRPQQSPKSAANVCYCFGIRGQVASFAIYVPSLSAPVSRADRRRTDDAESDGARRLASEVTRGRMVRTGRSLKSLGEFVSHRLRNTHAARSDVKLHVGSDGGRANCSSMNRRRTLHHWFMSSSVRWIAEPHTKRAEPRIEPARRSAKASPSADTFIRDLRGGLQEQRPELTEAFN